MSLRLISWNCHHAPLSARMAELAPLAADVAFVQEWLPSKREALPSHVHARIVGPRKGVALVAGAGVVLTPLPHKRGAGRASIAAMVVAPDVEPFNVIGLWARWPAYATDVMRTVKAYASLIRSAPTVVLGDFNSGSKLHGVVRVTKGHPPIVDALAKLGLVSAYHAFHDVAHGHEPHATYLHNFKRAQPWHLDFCFIPQSWTNRISSVDVLHDDEWLRRSDHAAVVVEMS